MQFYRPKLNSCEEIYRCAFLRRKFSNKSTFFLDENILKKYFSHNTILYLPRVKKPGRYQIAATVIREHEAVRYVDENGEAAGECHQLACNLLAAELWWFASWHAARNKLLVRDFDAHD